MTQISTKNPKWIAGYLLNGISRIHFKRGSGVLYFNENYNKRYMLCLLIFISKEGGFMHTKRKFVIVQPNFGKCF